MPTEFSTFRRAFGAVRRFRVAVFVGTAWALAAGSTDPGLTIVASRALAGEPARAASAATPASSTAAPTWSAAEPLSALDLTGHPHTLGQGPQTRAVAVVFLGSQCPVAQKYIPQLNRIAHEFAGGEVEFFGILAEPTLTRAAARRFADEYQLAFPVLFDGALSLAERLRPSHTPEAFVFRPNGDLLYRGRIDDRFADLLEARSQATRHELREAIAACLSRRTPPESAVPVGCRFEALAPAAAGRTPTYHRHVAPVLRQHCAACHRAGEAAPFTLVDYADAAPRAGQIVEVLTRRLMPPWKAEPGYGEFQGQRRLSQGEIDLVARWAESGAAEGDPADALPAAEFTPGWRLGEPDLVLEMPAEFEIPADGANAFRWFALRVPLDREAMVTAFEFRAGNPRVVHHAIMFLDNTGAATKLDDRDPAPGYDNFGGPGFLPTGFLGSWAPGVSPLPLPPGTGIVLKPGTVIALQMHYTPTGKPELDRSLLGLHLADDTAGLASVSTVPVFSVDLEIPPGVADHPAEASFVLPVPVRVIGLAPHMHYLGRRMQISAILPGGAPVGTAGPSATTEAENTTEAAATPAGVVPLLRITDWDFDWQDQYRLRQPVPLPAGTKLVVEARYDNTADNPDNPHAPPEVVRYGSQSSNEMCLAGIQVALDKPGDFTVIAAALIRQFMETRRGKPFVNPFE